MENERYKVKSVLCDYIFRKTKDHQTIEEAAKETEAGDKLNGNGGMDMRTSHHCKDCEVMK
jgi:hypothetical protein